MYDRSFTMLAGAGDPPGITDPGPGDTDDPINEYPFGDQDSPAVSMDAQGNFVAVWVEYGAYGDLPGEGN